MTQSTDRVRADACHSPLVRNGFPGTPPAALAMGSRGRAEAFLMTVTLGALLFLVTPLDARAACTPDPPTADGDSITCVGTDSTGYDGSAFDDLSVTVEPSAELDDSNPGLDAAILVNEGNTIVVRGNTLIDVTEDDGAGIRGGDHNDVSLSGTLQIDADDASGVSIGSRRDAAEPGEISVDSVDANIRVLGDRSVGLEAVDDVNVSNAGQIVVDGDDAQGISVGDRTQLDFLSSVEDSGTIDVNGTGSVGIRTGDGWYRNDPNADPADLSTATGTAVSHSSGATMNVTGTNAFGIHLGDDGNASNNHNSFATTSGTIDVTGVGAIGVSLGGNDLFVDPDETDQIIDDLLDFGGVPGSAVFGLLHRGTITGGSGAGPLVDIRDFSTGDNRIGITPDAVLNADPAGGPAIRGSDGNDFVINFGEIRGDVLLGDGDDRFAQEGEAIFEGTLDGGDGLNDELILAATDDGGSTFDVSNLANFELIRIGGGDGWSLANADGFTGLARVEPNGRFVVSSATELGGAFEVDATGTVEINLVDATPPLTVAGSASLDGQLVVIPDAGLAPSATPYRVILAGSRVGEFTDIDVLGESGTRLFTPEYDALGLTLLYEVLPLSSLARGSNNQAILDHLLEIDASGGGSDDVQSFIDELDNLTVDEANSAFNAMSPEAYDAQTAAVVDGGRRVAHLLLDRPRECTPGKLDPWTAARAPLPCHARSWSPWLSAVGGFRSREKNSGHPRYDASLGGAVAGIDWRPLEDLDLTFAIGSQRGKVNVAGAGESTLTLTDVAGHAAWRRGPVRVQTVLSWGHGFHDDKRRMRFISDGQGNTTSVRGHTDHDSDRVTLAAELGYAIDAGPFTVEPVLGLDWAWVWQRSFQEDDAGGFGLEVDDRDDEVGSISAGFRASTIYHHTRYLARPLAWMDGIWRPQLELRWRQMLEGTERDIDARMEGAPGSVSDFQITGNEDEGGVEIGVGVSFVPSAANRLQFDLRYETYVASHTVEQDLTARVLIGF